MTIAQIGDLMKRRRISNERKKRSWVWEYFMEDNEKLDPNKSTKWAKCKIAGCLCPSVKTKNRSTSNLAYHLKQVHGISPAGNVTEELEISEEFNDDKTENISKADQDLIDLKLYVNSASCKIIIKLESTSLLHHIHRLL